MTLRCKCGGLVRVQNGSDPSRDGDHRESYERQSCGRTGTLEWNSTTGRTTLSGRLTDDGGMPAGLQRARQERKWLGQVPAGVVRDDGYLKPNLDPAYSGGETGHLDVVEALEAIDGGTSYRKVARDTPNVTRQTLSNIDQDEERRTWYLDREAADDRVDEALAQVR